MFLCWSYEKFWGQIDSISPKVIREVFQKSRPMMISRGKAFQVVGMSSAKTMSLGFPWCVHRTEIRHCSQSPMKKKKGRDETGKFGSLWKLCWYGKALNFVLDAVGTKLESFEQHVSLISIMFSKDCSAFVWRKAWKGSFKEEHLQD